MFLRKNSIFFFILVLIGGNGRMDKHVLLDTVNNLAGCMKQVGYFSFRISGIACSYLLICNWLDRGSQKCSNWAQTQPSWYPKSMLIKSLFYFDFMSRVPLASHRGPSSTVSPMSRPEKRKFLTANSAFDCTL